MPKIAFVRNVAIGFKEDAEEILHEFANLETVEFSVFAEIWRRKKLSFIFLGRDTVHEMKEFTHECFGITVQLITSTAPYFMKAAVIYLLYSLYLKQKLSPKAQIRLQLHHYKEIERLYSTAQEKRHLPLCYVIHYLFSKSAFSFIAFPKLMGPLTSIETKEKDVKVTMELKNSAEDILHSGAYNMLSQIHNSYVKAKQGLVSVEDKGLNILLSSRYEDSARQLTTLVKDEVYVKDIIPQTSRQHNEEEDIGEQRRSLKHKQFQKRTEHYLLKSQSESQASEDDPNSTFREEESPIKRKLHRKRKVKRGRGRPKKEVISEKSSDDEMVIVKTEVLDTPENFNYDSKLASAVVDRPVKIRQRPKRRLHHYAETKNIVK